MINPVKQIYAMYNTDFDIIGEHLGYNSSMVIEEKNDYGLYGTDGNGYITLIRFDDHDKENYILEYDEILGNIIFYIFEINPEIKKIYVMGVVDNLNT